MLSDVVRGIHRLMRGWVESRAPLNVYFDSGNSSGNYQATSANYEKLHVLVADKNLNIERGLGGSVTATSKTIWPAYTPLYFRPNADADTLGWAGSSVTVSIGLLE